MSLFWIVYLKLIVNIEIIIANHRQLENSVVHVGNAVSAYMKVLKFYLDFSKYPYYFQKHQVESFLD